MDVSFDSSVSPEARKRFLENPVAPTGQMAQYEKYMNTPRGQHFGVTKIDNSPPPPMGWRTHKDLMLQELTNQQSRENNLANLEEQRQRAAIDKDKNRIDEQRVNSENKLRDIQGQVEQQPQEKESDVYDKIDIYNEAGMVTGQQLYNKRTGEKVEQPKFTESQEDIIKRLNQMRDSKDPKLAAAEAKYKAHFGSLPY